MRRATSVLGLVAVLAAAYWFDLYLFPPIRRAAGNTFDPVPALWTSMAAQLAIALAVVGLGWMLFRWSPPSRLVGLVYLVVGLALVGAWPIAAAFNADLPGFAELNLYLALSQPSGLLALVAPFVAALGLVRLVFPLSGAWRWIAPRPPVEDRPPAVLRFDELGIDALTGLGSRSAIADMRPGSSVALIDLIGFKRVNDTFGLHVGDRVLQEVAASLRDGLAPRRVYRAGGDKFAVEIDGPLDQAEASAVAERIRALVRRPLEGQTPLEARVGITLREIGPDAMSVLAEAERAVFGAASAGIPVEIIGPDPTA
jgi:diguanylate cyclase (GGDEF)-like protein